MKLKFLLNFPSGMLVGWVAAIMLAYVIEDVVQAEYRKYWFYIATACTTLAASGLAVWGVLSNVDHQRDQAIEARRRKFEATRAFLPLALSRVTEISREGYRISSNLDSIVAAAKPEDVLRSTENSIN